MDDGVVLLHVEHLQDALEWLEPVVRHALWRKLTPTYTSEQQLSVASLCRGDLKPM